MKLLLTVVAVCVVAAAAQHKPKYLVRFFDTPDCKAFTKDDILAEVPIDNWCHHVGKIDYDGPGARGSVSGLGSIAKEDAESNHVDTHLVFGDNSSEQAGHCFASEQWMWHIPVEGECHTIEGTMSINGNMAWSVETLVNPEF